jgi:hypothetical protein
MNDLPSDRDLMALPLRAIVAYSVRSARRVQPRFCLWLWASSPSPDARHITAIENAIAMAEQFALGVERTSSEFEDGIEAANRAARHAGEQSAAYAASTAAHAAHAAAYALRTARAAARYANPSPNETFPAPDTVAIMAAHASAAALHAGAEADLAGSDFRRLEKGQNGRYPELGTPVDPGETGPLGTLWPAGAPDWFRAGSGAAAK